MLDRRNFLKSAAAVSALGVSAIPATADPLAFSDHGDWRTYEIRTVVEIDSTEPVRIWAPAAAFDAPDWSRPLGTNWTGNADSAEIVRDPAYGAQLRPPRLEGGLGRTPRRDRQQGGDARPRRRHPRGQGAAAIRRPKSARSSPRRPRSFRPTASSKQTADRITAGATTDVDKARAILPMDRRQHLSR